MRPHIMGSSQVDVTDDGVEYLETVALLQEEIARLESELSAREEVSRASSEANDQCNVTAEPDTDTLRQEVSRLTSELASREETIHILLDELRFVEETQAATRAEWEQLAKWVAEVEDRVERQGQTETSHYEAEIAHLRTQAQEFQHITD